MRNDGLKADARVLVEVYEDSAFCVCVCVCARVSNFSLASQAANSWHCSLDGGVHSSSEESVQVSLNSPAWIENRMRSYKKLCVFASRIQIGPVAHCVNGVRSSKIY